MTVKQLVVLTGILLLVQLGHAQEDPDYSKEARIHQIFKKYNEQPTSEEAWQGVLSQGATRTYSVQAGDTLWGLSETLFGDPNYWPKIWSLNSVTVLNPHEIQPDQVIHFVEGTFGEPPTLAVKEPLEPEVAASAPQQPEETAEATPAPAEPAPEEAAPGPVVADGNVKESEIPPPLKTSTKFGAIPKSLPDWDPGSEVANYVFKLNKPAKEVAGVPKVLDYYLSDSSVVAEGVVTETENDMLSASEAQLIYVKFPSAPTGQKYLVIKENGVVKDPFSSNKGTLVRVEAEIQLMENVNPSKNLYRAAITHNLDHVSVGSKVVTGELTLINPLDSASGAAVSSRIIGGQFNTSRTLFGPDAIVFINSGLQNGVAVGQTLPIYKSLQLRSAKTEVVANNRLIGRMKIVHANEKFSTAVITEAIDDVRVGDSTESSTQ